ncbi:hypothetical protein AB0M46_17985 [Dactylosporangium sp. NPDC051485]
MPHPSLCGPPRGGLPRITVEDLGDGSARVAGCDRGAHIDGLD